MYCVIMGDIVNSRSLDDEHREQVVNAAKNVFDKINTNYSSSMMTPFGMVRGDSFEGVLLKRQHSTQIVQEIIKAFYRIDKTVVRISVVFGKLTLTSNDRNETDGPAFHTAIDALTKMKARKSNHWLQVSFDVDKLGKLLIESNMVLLSALTERWTDKQRETVWATEEHNGHQKDIGEINGVTPSVVNKQLKAAKYTAYRQAWDSLTEYFISLDEQSQNINQ